MKLTRWTVFALKQSSRTDRESRGTRSRRGVAAVEFAIIAPLFFLLLAGIIEFGQAFRIKHMLSSASRRGARAAVVKGVSTSQVSQNVKKQCVNTLSVNEGDVTVEIDVNGIPGAELSLAEDGDEISITVKIPYSKAGVGFYASMFSSATLSATCTLEHE